MVRPPDFMLKHNFTFKDLTAKTPPVELYFLLMMVVRVTTLNLQEKVQILSAK